MHQIDWKVFDAQIYLFSYWSISVRADLREWCYPFLNGIFLVAVCVSLVYKFYIMTLFPLINCNNMSVDSFGFSMYVMISSVNNDGFTFSFPIFVFIFFSFLTALLAQWRTMNMSIIEMVVSLSHCQFPVENLQYFTRKDKVCCSPFNRLKFPFINSLQRVLLLMMLRCFLSWKDLEFYQITFLHLLEITVWFFSPHPPTPAFLMCELQLDFGMVNHLCILGVVPI